MPRYVFKNLETSQEEVHWLSISELSLFLEENKHLEQTLSAPRMADPVRLGIHKPDSGFRDALKHVKSSHHKSTVNTW